MEEEEEWNTGPTIEDIISQVLKSKRTSKFGSMFKSRLAPGRSSAATTTSSSDGVPKHPRTEELKPWYHSRESRNESSMCGANRAQPLTNKWMCADRNPLSATKHKKHSHSTPELRSKFMTAGPHAEDGVKSAANRKVEFTKLSGSSVDLHNKENIIPMEGKACLGATGIIKDALEPLEKHWDEALNSVRKDNVLPPSGGSLGKHSALLAKHQGFKLSISREARVPLTAWKPLNREPIMEDSETSTSMNAGLVSGPDGCVSYHRQGNYSLKTQEGKTNSHTQNTDNYQERLGISGKAHSLLINQRPGLLDAEEGRQLKTHLSDPNVGSGIKKEVNAVLSQGRGAAGISLGVLRKARDVQRGPTIDRQPLEPVYTRVSPPQTTATMSRSHSGTLEVNQNLSHQDSGTLTGSYYFNRSTNTSQLSRTLNGSQQNTSSLNGSQQNTVLLGGTQQSTGSLSISGSSTGTQQSSGSSTVTQQSSGSSTVTQQSSGSSTVTQQSSGSSTGTQQSSGSSTGTQQSSGSSTGTQQSSGSSTGTQQSSGSSIGTQQNSGSSTGTQQSSGSSTGTQQSSGSSTGTQQSSGSSIGTQQSSGSSIGTQQSSGSSIGTQQSSGSSTGTQQSSQHISSKSLTVSSQNSASLTGQQLSKSLTSTQLRTAMSGSQQLPPLSAAHHLPPQSHSIQPHQDTTAPRPTLAAVIPQSHLSTPRPQPQPPQPQPCYRPQPPQPHPQPPQPSMMKPPSTQKAKKMKTWIINGKEYLQLNFLGRGGSSKVYEMFDVEGGRAVAVKVVDLECVDKDTEKSYKNEITILQQLQALPRVIKLFDYEERGTDLYLVMERGNGDLVSVLKKGSSNLTTFTVQHYWHGMLLAVKDIHTHGIAIIHSDLKPANFLLVNDTVKLIDFGIASSIQPDMTSITKDTQAGTFNYMSPESLPDMRNRGLAPSTIKIGIKSDVWSLGCILYNLVYGHTPFQHILSPMDKLRAISSQREVERIPFPDIPDRQLLEVLQLCLKYSPKDRPSIDELLRHPYLTAQRWTEGGDTNSGEQGVKGQQVARTQMGEQQGAKGQLIAGKQGLGSQQQEQVKKPQAQQQQQQNSEPQLNSIISQLSQLSPNSLGKLSSIMTRLNKDGTPE